MSPTAKIASPLKKQARQLFGRLQQRPFIYGVIAFLLMATLVATLAYQRLQINREVIQQDTYNHALAAKERIRDALEQGMAANQTISLFIQRDNTVKDFDSIARQILAVNKVVDAIQLVPGGEITQVYPLAGNESLIGYNILNDSFRKQEALKAIRKKELFYAGPFQLRQGGMGIVGRLPVFRDNKFWGFSAVVIKMPGLIKAAGIDSLGKNGYYFQLSKKNPVNGVEEFFVSYPSGFEPGEVATVVLTEEEWKLSAFPVKSNKGFTNLLLFIIVGLLFAIMCGMFIFTLVRKPALLDELVKQRTAALEESEKKYRLLIEQASDAIIVYNLDGTIRQFNKAAYTETGYSREEFANLNLKEILLEKIVVIDQSRVEELQAGKNVNFERQLFRKDGSIINIEINANLLPNGDVLAFVRNITERRVIEKALKESEEKFSKAFRSNLLPFAIVNGEEKIVDANDSIAAMLGTTRESLLGKTMHEISLIGNVDIAANQQSLDNITHQLYNSGRIKNLEINIETRDGKYNYLLLTIEPLEISGKKNWLITAIDITQKKQTELSLIHNEEKYRSLIEQASDGIVITDLMGYITEVNNSICAMGGYAVEEMIGGHVNHFLPREDVRDLPLRIDELLKGKTLLYERRMLKKDGTNLSVEINSKMASGNTLIGFVRDITERKKASEELRKSNERFELIARATNDAFWDLNVVTDVTVGNENYYRLYNIQDNKINLDAFKNRLHPDDLGPVMLKMQQAFDATAPAISEEYRFRVADGSYKIFHDRAFITYDEDGQPMRILGVMQDITGRRENEQQLLKEKELSDSIINSLPAVFYLYNMEGKFLRWNTNFETVTGYSSQEIKELRPLDYFKKEERKKLYRKIRKVFLNGHDSVEAEFLLKNGQTIPYYFSGMRIEYEGQTCLMGFGLDFSDKVQADRLIKESEQKFRSLVEQATDGVAILSPGGKARYVSPSVKRILGYSEEEYLQLDVFGITHPDDLAGVEAVFESVLEHPGIPMKGYTSRALHKDGSWRWLEDTITNMLHLPSINGIVANFRDITERLEIEQRIVNEKELSDSIINNLPGIFYLYDRQGKFIRWNSNFETISGYSAEEIRQMHPLDFYVADDRSLMKQRIASIFTEELPAVELRLQTRDNQQIPIFINSHATEYEGMPCIMGMGFDATERKKMELELLLSNQQLAHQANLLKSSNTELERFAYIVSHDLQEPLRMVSSFLKLLQQKYQHQLDATGDKYIHFAVDGAERMKQLIMDLLEYSRTGTNKDITSITDMNEVMKEVLKVLAPSIQEQEAQLVIGLLPVLPDTSKLQMFQLMQNLLSNALKYHGDQKLLIRVSAEMVEGDWQFAVQDNGIGIDPKFADKIFVIFQRLHNKTEFSGTGIGLSICKKIVEKHGGKIWVESVPGQGSTFYFTIKKRMDTESDFIPYGE